jgi:hypothetical protein
LELNHWYLWTVQNLTNLLKNHEDLQDFPEQFEPVLPDLYPSTIGDLEWQDVIAPSVESFMATVQKYVMTKRAYEPEEKTPAWLMIEMFQPSIRSALECAEKYHTRMTNARKRVLSLPHNLSAQEVAVSAPKSAPSGTCFPTPEGTYWTDVAIRFTDGETVSIKAGAASGIYSYGDLGMSDGRNKRPTKQWELLRVFARHNGLLTWENSGADRKNQKRRELLAENLRAFFGISGEPIVLTKNKKGWQVVFTISEK